MLYEGGDIDERDYKTYVTLFQNMSNFMKKPNIIVHLDISPEESLNRIKMRNRGCETTISLDYLRALHAGYQNFINDISKVIPVIQVNYEQFKTVDEMVEAIAEQYASMSTVRHVFYDNPSSKEKENSSVEQKE